MTQEHGFELLREQTIPEVNAHARLYRHSRTGAHLLALANDDENKTFSVAFRTRPTDHTGVPHIIEHAVLCGSHKYPVKEPFVELMKGSLATYLNAGTSLDSTHYPVASQNLEDFFNLVDVYLDAVLHPLLTRQTFDQEAWHYELEDVGGPLAYRGVVFNEMKGNYSTPEVILLLETLRALFPDTEYGYDVGGDPERIPDLTYEQFHSFYATHYHPANALFFLHGDLPIAAGLERIDRALAGFGPGPAAPPPALQPPFAAPRAITAPYPVGGEEDNKAYVTVTWVTVEDAEPVDVLTSAVLSYALIGSPASPLRKALIDSGLGEDLALLPNWFATRQLLFSAGLKGVNLQDTGRVEPLIQRTLETLAREGLEPEMVEAALNTVEFALRENSGSEGQPGISLFERAAASWLHGGDPFAALAFAAPLARLKDRLAADPRHLARLIQAWLLDNPHRLTVLLEPDPLLQQRREATEQTRLAAAGAAMTAAERQAVVENTRTLRRLQETPNSPEALATLPVLRRSDLDPRNRPIPSEVGTESGSRVLYHALPTNGIVYLDVGLDLRALSQEDLPYATVLGRVLLEMGTAREDFVRLSQRIDRTTGGIEPMVLASAARGTEGPAWLLLRGKAMADRGPALLEILRDVLLTVRLDNPERFRQIVGEEKARREAGLLPLGARLANMRLSAHFGQAGWVSDTIGGLGGLFAVRRLAQEAEQDWPSVLARLEAMRAKLVNRAAMLVNVTLEPALWAGLRPALTSFLADLPANAFSTTPWSRPTLPAGEGFAVPSAVNYVGKGAALYALGYTLDGSILAISKYLNTTWLWDKVRAQGGAYGGMAAFSHLSGMFSYLSYRDPNLLETIANYDGSADFLRQLDLSEAELTKSIIGGIGDMDVHMLPAAKGLASLARYLTGDTDEHRQRLRDELLSTTVDDFRRFAEVLDAVRQEGHVVILGAEEALRAANEQRGGDWLQVSRAL